MTSGRPLEGSQGEEADLRLARRCPSLERGGWRWAMLLLPFVRAVVAGGVVWDHLPPIPDREGFAGCYAGVSDGVLLVAGGANFPEGKPWEGGKKVWHDAIYALDQPQATWKLVGRLPRALAYGVSMTVPQGVVCVGGSDAEGHHATAFILKLTGGALRAEPLPDLPIRLAYCAGALLGSQVFLCGGSEEPGERSASRRLFTLDLTTSVRRWEEREPFPGRPRILSAAAGLANGFYLMGGAALEPADGGARRVYLREAWRYEHGRGWQRRADLPRPRVAAASPAPVAGSRCYLVGGDDGSKVGFQPVQEHPGFPKDLLVYDASNDTWAGAGELTTPRATWPAAWWRDRFVLPCGEVRPGVRTPEVLTLRLTP